MCDTRTWVFKLLLVFLIIHISRIQQWRVAAVPAVTAVGNGGGRPSTDADAISIDDDSFEITSSPEDTLTESQRPTLNNSTYSNRKSNSNSNKEDVQSLSGSPSSTGSIANRLASDDGVADGDEGPDADADDDDGSNEEFNGSQRKFNNAADAEREAPAESNRALVFGILRERENEKDYVGYTKPSTPPTESTPAPWNANAYNDDDEDDAADDDDDDDEDVDEILQPMMISSDKRHYNSNNGGRAMGSGQGYPMEYHPNGNSDKDGSAGYKETSVTNRIKSGYSSAFEQHKALIRNSKRYGHKSHKKKYKDYLHYNPPTTTTATPLSTTTFSPLQEIVLARDKIYNSDDMPRPYYPGHVNYYTNTDDYDGDAEKKDQRNSPAFKSYHSPSYPRHYQQHHNNGHLRNGGRYRHLGVQRKNQQRPHSSMYPDYNMMNFHHLGSRAKQQHQKELEKKIDEYSQYYSKWPHLAQVEDQLFDDEHTDVLYPDGDGLSSNPGELVFAAEDDDDGVSEKDDEDPNLPPYIKKYRRRNKQLMDLLEGTRPPSTSAPQWSSSILKPGPIEGNHQNASPRHHLRQHRAHHHHRQHRNQLRSHRHKHSKWPIEDLFEEQRANPNNPNRTTSYDIPKPSTSTTTTSTTTPFDEHLKLLQENKLPAEDVSISRELYDWAIEIGRDTPDNDDYIDNNQNGLHSWKTNRNQRPAKSLTTTTLRPVASVRRPNVYGSIMKSPPLTRTSTAKPINSFVYHRVVEAPRVVGAGQTGRKQRLPFVAITDRRLETTKKGMGNAGVLARKDFEQNHFPMP